MTSIAAESALKSQVRQVKAARSARVGAVYRCRLGLRLADVAVIDDQGEEVTVVDPAGEIRAVRSKKLRDARFPPSVRVRSLAGRLQAVCGLPSDRQPLTPEALATVSDRLEELIKDPDEALGLVMDSGELGLSPEFCYSLPVEPWRVRYQVLATHQLSDDVAVDIARRLVRDASAPDAVRLVVGLVHKVELDSLEPLFDELFHTAGQPSEREDPAREDGVDELMAAALQAGGLLESLGLDEGITLSRGASSPHALAEEFALGSVLGVLDGSLPPSTVIDVDAALPVSVIDDLIDAGAPIRLSTLSGDAQVETAISLETYLTARLQPVDLTAEQVQSLAFDEEMFRRVALSGDDQLAEQLPEDRRRVADAVRQIRAGVTPSATPTGDDRLDTLIEVLDGSSASELPGDLLSDRSVWPSLLRLGPATTEPATEPAQQLSDLAAVHAARDALFEWRWEEARDIARRGLRWAREEVVRDELLNIIACSLWLAGEPEPALAALEKALEGDYTQALLTNAAIVASELDHTEAVRHITRLAREAPDSERKAIAAERALMLWANRDARIWEEDEEEDELPHEIRDALRGLISHRLPTERYVRLLRALAVHDSEWLAAQPLAAFGVQQNEPAASLFRARARGLDEFIGELGQEFRRGVPAQWIQDERDEVVEAAVNVLVDDISNEAAAFFGMAVIEAGIPIPDERRVALVALTVASISSNIDPEEAEPKTHFIDWIIDARDTLARLPEDDRSRMQTLVEMSANELARSFAASRYHELDAAIDGYNEVIGALSRIPSWQVNRVAVSSTLRKIRDFCWGTSSVLGRVRGLVTDDELRQGIDAILNDARELDRRAAGVLS